MNGAPRTMKNGPSGRLRINSAAWNATCFHQIGKLAAKDITPKILLAALRKVESRGAYDIAKRLLQTCNQIFFYAMRTEICASNPAQALRGVLKTRPVKHLSAIEAKDLPEFMSLLAQNKARFYPQTVLAIRFMMLTFVRTSEMILRQMARGRFKGQGVAYSRPSA